MNAKLKCLLRHLYRVVLPMVVYSPRWVRDRLFCILHRLPRKTGWRLWGLPIVSISRGAKIAIGNNLVLCSDSRHNSIGVFQKVLIRVDSRASLIIGDNVGISGTSISVSQGLTIGNNVKLGSGCLIVDTDAHPINLDERRMDKRPLSSPIVIGDDVFIGARSIILKGVTIGTGAVIGAGSVVAKDIPEYAIGVGNPVRIIGDSRDEKHKANDEKQRLE